MAKSKSTKHPKAHKASATELQDCIDQLEAENHQLKDRLQEQSASTPASLHGEKASDSEALDPGLVLLAVGAIRDRMSQGPYEDREFDDLASRFIPQATKLAAAAVRATNEYNETLGTIGEGEQPEAVDPNPAHASPKLP